MDDDRTVHLDTAAADVGVSRRTLYHWMAAGLLPFTTTQHGGQRSRRVRLGDVRQLARTRPSERAVDLDRQRLAPSM